jgi:hypothetical protein
MYINHLDFLNNKSIVWDPQHLMPLNNILETNPKKFKINNINI